MFEWIKNIFKKEEQLEFPNDFAVIMLTDVAKKSNINDDFNKKIFRFKKGKLFKTYDYSEKNVKNLKEICEIPVVEENIAEEYKFAQGTEYGQVGR